VHIPSVAACSLGHRGSDRSCCACSSNTRSLHKRTDNSVDVPDLSFNALSTRLSKPTPSQWPSLSWSITCYFTKEQWCSKAHIKFAASSCMGKGGHPGQHARHIIDCAWSWRV